MGDESAKQGYKPVTPGHWLSYGDTDALQFLYDALNTDKHNGKLAGKKIVVVGAGYAGLCASLCLQKCGAKVYLYEASKRLGGRVWSSNYNPEAIKTTDGDGGNWIEGNKLSTNSTYELGAELIGEFHECYKVIAEYYGLTGSLVRLEDVDYKNASVGAIAYNSADDKTRSVVSDETYNNVKGSMEKLVLMHNESLETDFKNFDQVFGTTFGYSLDGALDNLTFTVTGGEKNINQSVDSVLTSISGIDTDGLSKDYAAIASVNLRNFVASDNLKATDNMNYLTLFYTAQGAGSCDFWDDNETYINSAGNSSLVTKIAATLDAGGTCILANSPVTKISGLQAPFKVSAYTDEDNVDAVILTIPPANFPSITEWPGSYAGATINQLTPGQAAAYKAHFHASGLPALTDTPSVEHPIKITKEFSLLDSLDYSPYYMVWNRGGLVDSEDILWSLFAGEGFNALAGSFDALPYSLSRDEGKTDKPIVFPVVSADEKVLIRWAKNPCVKTGYSFGGFDNNPSNGGKTSKVQNHLVGAVYALRNASSIQVQIAEPKSLMPKGFHFAGEHTSPYFMGFMEGALRSGARAAMKIVEENT